MKKSLFKGSVNSLKMNKKDLIFTPVKRKASEAFSKSGNKDHRRFKTFQIPLREDCQKLNSARCSSFDLSKIGNEETEMKDSDPGDTQKTPLKEEIIEKNTSNVIKETSPIQPRKNEETLKLTPPKTSEMINLEANIPEVIPASMKNKEKKKMQDKQEKWRGGGEDTKRKEF